MRSVIYIPKARRILYLLESRLTVIGPRNSTVAVSFDANSDIGIGEDLRPELSKPDYFWDGWGDKYRCRFLFDVAGKLYVWPAALGVHDYISKALQLKGRYERRIWGYFDCKIHGLEAGDIPYIEFRRVVLWADEKFLASNKAIIGLQKLEEMFSDIPISWEVQGDKYIEGTNWGELEYLSGQLAGRTKNA